MPEALATTKRKFHRLLDSKFGPAPAAASSPSNPKTPAANPQSTIIEPANKRIRSGASTSSLASSLHKQDASRLSIASIRTVGSTRTVNAPPQPTREPPNFAPWSHDTFLVRIRTFSRVTQWHPKPEAVNEVEWAKRGWSCVDTNTVCCKGGCGQRLLVNVDPVVRRSQHKEDQKEPETTAQEEAREAGDVAEAEGVDTEELENALVERYKGLIIEGHAEGCLWRQVGCKPDIYRLPIVKSTVWQPTLREHYNSLLKVSDSLESVHLKPDDLDPSPDKLLTDLPTTILASDASPTADADDEETSPESLSKEATRKAFLAAITGWHGATESGTDLLLCHACFQRIGLWMYQPTYKRVAFSSVFDDDDDAGEQDRVLDLVDLHREHCPWRNEKTQAAMGEYAGFPAWKILLRVVERYVDEVRRHSVRQSVRRSMTPVVRSGEDIEAGSVRASGEEEEVDAELALLPELTREETEKLDKERSSKLKKLKKVFGFKSKPISRPTSMAGPPSLI